MKVEFSDYNPKTLATKATYNTENILIIPRMPVLQNKETTPTTNVQQLIPDNGYDGLAIVTVNAIPSQYIIPANNLNITTTAITNVTPYATVQVVDANLIPENIPEGITILGVTGTRVETTGFPLIAETDAEMIAYNTPNNIGKIVKFIGTTGTYEHNRLYEIMPQLEPPTISLSGSNLTITETDATTTHFEIWDTDNNIKLTEIQKSI